MVLLHQDTKEEFSTLQSFLHSIKNNREWINDHVKKVGALVFRGFPVKTASDFNMVMEAFGWEEQSYAGAATRTRIEGRIFTATEASLHQPINFHHEMCLPFFCEIPPPDGGQTAILLSHKITERMEEKYPELVSKIEKEGFPAEDEKEEEAVDLKCRKAF
ncbi:hypothetical protein SUGI_0868200 [Cryptomeria japonica]|nr:hypothetical protein SUGI_0868200 [Cryptomeria japonica]